MSTRICQTRLANPGDGLAISKVHQTAWQFAYQGIIPHLALQRMIQKRDCAWWEQMLARKTAILVTLVYNNIVGYATYGQNRIPTLPGNGEVYELYVRPEYHGMGLGTDLFLAARKQLLTNQLVGSVVWVLEDNHQAIRFYKNAGGKALATGHEWFDGTKVIKLAYGWG